MRGKVGKCPVESADRRACGADDDDVLFHPKLLWWAGCGARLALRHCRILGTPESPCQQWVPCRYARELACSRPFRKGCGAAEAALPRRHKNGSPINGKVF